MAVPKVPLDMEAESFDHRIPQEAAALAKWFAEGVRAELKALERNGGTQVYEVHSGKLIESKEPNQGVFSFIIADGTRIPEDATGRLNDEGNEYTATVIGQRGNIIHLFVQGRELPPGIHWARLTIDDTALLRRLAEVLEERSVGSTNPHSLATSVFHPSTASIGSTSLPATPSLVKITGSLRSVLEKACGSSVTYVWGPPGTGKTYTIAYLITSLIEAGERVLVSSHTHAAVDQALYEAVRSQGNEPGPLANHPTVGEGRVLRVGVTSDPKVPDSVRFDNVLELKGEGLHHNILEIEAQIRPLSQILERGRGALSEWDKLAELANRLDAIKKSIKDADSNLANTEETISQGKDLIRRRTGELEKAQRAWFMRKARTRRAEHALEESKSRLREAEEALRSIIEKKKTSLQVENSLQLALERQRQVCKELPKREIVEKEISEKAAELEPLEEKLSTLQEELSRLAQTVINEAHAIFCTLTKNYVAKELEDQEFDAVIIDEISIALPPLIFLAAERAKLREKSKGVKSTVDSY